MEPNFIYETIHWKIILAADQSYLGRCVIVLKRSCGDLADISEEELLDFLQVVKKLENAFRKAFGSTMFNWGCLMNNAYQNNPPDPQVHWHVRPRYNRKVEFAGEVFEDTKFGYHYSDGNVRIVPDSVREKIVERLRKSL